MSASWIRAILTWFLIAGLSACQQPQTQSTALVATNSVPCAFLDGNLKPPLDAKTCSANPGLCAKTLNVCLKDLDYLTQPGLSVLKAPFGAVSVSSQQASTVRALASVQGMTPMHGRYNTVFLNDTAAVAFNQQITRDPATHFDTAQLPYGSVVIKKNFSTEEPPPADFSKLEGEPWLTVMVKIKGYCQPTVGGGCLGGEWFYYLYRFGNFMQFNEIPVYGKPQAFCTDCHNPVAKSDYLWNLHLYVRGRQQPYIADGAKPADGDIDDLPPSAVCANGELGIGPEPPADVPFAPHAVPQDQRQAMFDCFSWRSFLALNWPAKSAERGVPDQQAALRDVRPPRVWETYKEIAEVFQPQDANWKVDNQAWNDSQFVPQVCQEHIERLDSSERAKLLQMITKTRSHQVLNETHQAMGNQFNILVDQSGKLVRYEVRFNRDEFEYLKANGYANTGNYSYGGPNQGEVYFPTNADGATGLGAIEIKAAWRDICTPNSGGTCLPPEEALASRYYSQNALVYTAKTRQSEESCRLAKVGLVGLHIIRKTVHSPQWVWSTFEHVDNVPDFGQPAKDGTDYLLYSAACQENLPTAQLCSVMRPGVIPFAKEPNRACCENAQLIVNANPGRPDPNGELQADDGKVLKKNQVTRLVAVGPVELNKRIRLALPLPWANYLLLNTQWPSGARQTADQVPAGATRRIPCNVADLLWSSPGGTASAFVAAGIPKPSCYTMQPRSGSSELKLRNTTMETYQAAWNHPGTAGATQSSVQSCFNCHGFSGVDFSFAWTDATEEIVPFPPLPPLPQGAGEAH